MSGQSVGGIDPRLLDAAKSGDAARIKELVEQDGSILSRVTPEGNTVLHLALRFGWSESKTICELCPLDILMQHNKKGQTAMHLVVLSCDIQTVWAIESKFVADVEYGGREALRQMLRTADSNGDTALHLALRCKLQDIARRLMDTDLHLVNLVNKNGESPLYLAARGGLFQAVDMFLFASPTIYRGPPPNNPTPRHAAVIAHDEGTVRYLLRTMPGLVKETDGRGFIPLHYSVRSARLKITKILLDHDPSTGYIRDDDGNMAIHIAARYDRIKTFNELYARCPDSIDAVNGSHENVFHCAVKCSYSVDCVVLKDILLQKKLLKLVRTLLNQQDNNGNTPLHHAILAGKFHSSFNDKFVIDVLDSMIINNNGHTACDLFYSRSPEIAPSKRSLFEDFFDHIMPLGPEVLNYSSSVWNERFARLEKYAGNVALLATLMATITFAAAFTMPGGYSSDGEDMGKVVLFRNVALKVFVVSDAISMCCSLMVAFLFSSSKLYNKPATYYTTYKLISGLLMKISFVGMLLAFATGMYAVLAPKCMWLGILVCVMCAVLPFITFIVDNLGPFIDCLRSAFDCLKLSCWVVLIFLVDCVVCTLCLYSFV